MNFCGVLHLEDFFYIGYFPSWQVKTTVNEHKIETYFNDEAYF